LDFGPAGAIARLLYAVSNSSDPTGGFTETLS
jgi:hypothetical protein